MSKTKAEELYADIIDLPHHELTTRQRMPVINRAASFSPFAALTGYDEHIREAGRLTDERTDLDEDTKQKLNERLRIALDMVDVQPQIKITYFLPDERKSGGSYVEYTGVFMRVDEYEKKIILADKTQIPIDDIYEIDGEIFNCLE